MQGIEEDRDGRTYIVMAFYEGETLARKISRGHLPLGEAVDIAIQTARGKVAAHSRAVIHRDIKPGNIILTQQNAVKIVDFGLARVNTSAGTTQTRGTSGTIGYMSPEQTLSKPVDQRTDIWALGIVIAEMITGKNPFYRESPTATIFAILNEAPTLADEIPLDLRRIIYRALSKDAVTRYRTASEMLADMEAFRSHLEPTSAESRVPSASNDLAFRETDEHASRQMWPPPPSRPKNSFWCLGSFAPPAVLLVLLSFIPPIVDGIAGLFGRHEQHIA